MGRLVNVSRPLKKRAARIESVPPVSNDKCLVMILIDTSLSMQTSYEIIKNAIIHTLEFFGGAVTRNNMDVTVCTFNTEMNMYINIPFMELNNLLDDTSHLQPQYERMLQFSFNGGSPIGYALNAGIQDLLAYKKALAESETGYVRSSVLFFFSDGKQEVYEEEKDDNDRLLNRSFKTINRLVGLNELSVVSVESGLLCQTPVTSADRQLVSEMHELMRRITGLDTDQNVVRLETDETNLIRFISGGKLSWLMED